MEGSLLQEYPASLDASLESRLPPALPQWETAVNPSPGLTDVLSRLTESETHLTYMIAICTQLLSRV